MSYNKDNLHDYAYDVATDSEDNFVVVGAVLVNAATDHYDWAVRKYASDGSLVWETQSDLSAGNDQAYSSVTPAYTARVLMLKLVPIPMFADGFEQP